MTAVRLEVLDGELGISRYDEGMSHLRIQRIRHANNRGHCDERTTLDRLFDLIIRLQLLGKGDEEGRIIGVRLDGFVEGFRSGLVIAGETVQTIERDPCAGVFR